MSYLLPESNQQIKVVISKYKNYYKLCTLIAKFYKKNNYAKFIFYLISNYKNDISTYEKIFNTLQNNGGGYPKMDAEYIKRTSDKFIKNKITSYLDIGCGDGNFTEEFGLLLNVKAYGTDLDTTFEENWTVNKNINFKIIKDNKIPFKKTFDIITVIMVLHHIEEVDDLLKNIYEHMATGGLLIIKEHDTIDNNDKIFADIEHSLFLTQNFNKNKERILQQHNYYFSESEWDKKLIKAGFKYLHSEIFNSFRKEYTITRSYLSIWSK